MKQILCLLQSSADEQPPHFVCVMQVNSGAKFNASMAACPNLKSFGAYKFWAFDGLKQKWHLPECTDVDLDRADDLVHLEFWAPKLTHLSLMDCYDLSYFRLLPEQGPRIKIHLCGTAQSLKKSSMQHLEKHPRVGKERINYNDKEEFLNEGLDEWDDLEDPDHFRNQFDPDNHSAGTSQAELKALLQQLMGMGHVDTACDTDEDDSDYNPDASDSAEELLSDSEADTTDCSEAAEPQPEAVAPGSTC